MAKRIVAESSWIAPDFSPETFNRLTTVSSVYKPPGAAQSLQDFRCECGKIVTKPRAAVKHGTTRSCGCLRSEILVNRNKSMATHGYFGTPTYRSWSAMIVRCEDETHMAYHNYGGRGITVSPELRTFEGFLAHLGPRPSIDHSLDRIDNSKGYEPGNVRWATRVEQCRNTRVNRLVTYNGKTQPISAWAAEYGIPYTRLHSRIKTGWSAEDALTTPSGVRRKSYDPVAIANANPHTKKYTYAGETLSISQWSRKLGMRRETLQHRLNVGWPFEKAVTLPVKHKKVSNKASDN